MEAVVFWKRTQAETFKRRGQQAEEEYYLLWCLLTPIYRLYGRRLNVANEIVQTMRTY